VHERFRKYDFTLRYHLGGGADVRVVGVCQQGHADNRKQTET
jgi:hypothetical protein